MDTLNNKMMYFFQDLETISSLSMGTLSLISDNIDSFFSEDFSYRGIRNYLQKVEGLNLSMDELSAVLSFDWLFYDSSFDAYDPFVEALTAAGMSNSDAKDLYYTILQLQEQSGVYDFKINTSIGITSNLNDFKEKVEESLETIDVTLNIVDASFEGDITVSDLNDYIDSMLESDFNTANWWEMFSFDEEGKVQIDYDIMAQVPQEDYENEFMLLEGSRRDMY
ncbi:MAG: hypothetical protein LUC37_02965 [Prevotella sp.]|nr:hypothetical protein [Prevotella sp.]